MSVEGPLSGITVIDLTRVLAGPYCTMVLADLGARVIKVEPPEGDDARLFGPFVKGRSAYFMSLNRDKESIVLDLKDKEDRNRFETLLASADVLAENYRPGAMEKLGYGWDGLHDRFPRLIYAATSGFGHTGPLSHRPAYDLIAQAMGGLMSLTGHPGGPPTRAGTSLGDIAAGLFTAIGVTAALYHRRSSGLGAKVDVSMLDSQVALLENAIARFAATGVPPAPLGARHPSIAPFDAFSAKDGAFVLAIGNDSLFFLLCETIGRDDLASNALYSSNELRCEHPAGLKDELEKTFMGEPIGHWLAAFEKAGVPAGPINSIDRLLDEPQLFMRNMIVTAKDPVAGPIRMAGNPVKISGFPDEAVRAPAPALDGDRECLLKELEETPLSKEAN